MKIKHSMWRWLSVAALTGLCSAALAQAYPNRAIRMIVAGSPGGGTDLISRLVGQKLTEAWDQQVIADNRVAAAGNIAYEFVANAPPDGYTLLVVTASFATNPALYQKVAYDPIKDFAPIMQLAAMSYVFVVPPTVLAKTVKEFIAIAKARKPPLTYASGGSGQLAHLGMELLKTLSGFDAVHVPFKGDSPAMIAMLGGSVDSFLSAMPVALPHITSGKIRALAVTGSQRSPLMTDIPTVAESGFAGYEVNGWFGLLAPASTSREVVSKLHREASRILTLADIRKRLADGGIEPVASTPEEFSTHINSEMIKWAKIIKQSGARAD